MSEENNKDEITEKIKIIATDDERIKSFGELLTNDSSRAILQLLFNDELTALQIAEKTGISLQLVKYHIIKLQDLGVVKVTKVEKNSKSQDMKFYSASKFSMVIVPPKYSEKTKESKLLVRSFKHIYKIAGFGIAAGISGLMSLSLMQQDKRVIIEESAQMAQSEPEPSSQIVPESSQDYTLEEALEIQKRGVEAAEANPVSGSGTPIFDFGDLAVTLIILAVVFGGFVFWGKLEKKSSKGDSIFLLHS
jgi:DNA-binding transcriptional ArsR family regulator